jgi:hypothetical protein
LDGDGIDGFLAGLQRGQHGGEGDVLDEARNAAGVMEDGRESLGLEGILAGAGGLEVTLDEEGDFGLVRGRKRRRTPSRWARA